MLKNNRSSNLDSQISSFLIIMLLRIIVSNCYKVRQCNDARALYYSHYRTVYCTRPCGPYRRATSRCS